MAMALLKGKQKWVQEPDAELHGFSRNPFCQKIATDSSFYKNPILMQRIEFLDRLIKSDDFLILVLGEKGSGKTTMLHYFLSHGGDNWRSCKIRPAPEVNKESELETLDGYPAFVLLNPDLPMIMLDDAHDLSIAELQFMMKPAGGSAYKSRFKRMVLFCEPRIQLKLAQIPDNLVDNGITNKLYIPPLNPEHTEYYINHRLKISGLDNNSPFTKSDIKNIFDQSGGIPYNINAAAAKIVAAKTGARSVSAGKPGISVLWIATGLAAMIITLSFVMPTSIDQPNGVQKKGMEPEKIAVATKEDPIKMPGLTIPDSAPIKAETKKEMLAADIADNKVQALKSGEKIYREKWLLSQKASHYTLQIVGVSNEESLYKFVEKHKLIGKCAYFHTRYRNADWYPLLYGVFPSYKKASSEIKKLPREIRLSSPWVRRISSIQSKIAVDLQ